MSRSLSSALQGMSSALPASLPEQLHKLPVAMRDVVGQALLNWQDATRLYRIETAAVGGTLPGALMVESFVRVDRLSESFWMQVNCLSLDATVDDRKLCGQAVALITRLADGSEHRVSGYVTDVQSLGGNGGFGRYALTVRPWLALPAYGLDSNGWTDKSLIDIVEAVFSAYPGIAAWRWDEGVEAHLREGLLGRSGGKREYCVQYRESDADFLSRLLVEEGIGWRLEEEVGAPGGHCVVFFADSYRQPQDQTSAAGLIGSGGGQGIRFHRSSSQEAQDSIQAFGALRRLGPMATAVQGWSHEGHRAHTAQVPTHHQWGGEEAIAMQPWLESYDPSGSYLLDNDHAAKFLTTCMQQAQEARFKSWVGMGSVRTLRPGTWFALTQSTLDVLSAFGAPDSEREFFVTATTNVGINNLPAELHDAAENSLGESLSESLALSAQAAQQWARAAQHAANPRRDIRTTPDDLGAATPDPALPDLPDLAPLIERAAKTGYACQFEVIRRDIPWRPVLLDGTGLRPRPRHTAQGTVNAIVVGPDGSTTPNGADELYTDGRGRIKVRFIWQDERLLASKPGHRSESKRISRHSCWVRVMQRLAGPGMGHQFIPRIGMEVLVTHVGNDADMPIVIGALNNGRGEGGVQRTPGGKPPNTDTRTHTSAFAESTDHRPASQMNLVNSGSGGNSPPWHGAAPGDTLEGHPGQNNAAALSGVKSKEFGGWGHNQLVMDDTPHQQSLKLHSTQRQSWLQMGHLLHQADNHRGSFRGLGFDLRTDAWGGLRAVRGVMLSTYTLGNGLGQQLGAGDNTAGIALARQMQQLAETFHQAATTHQTVGLAAAAGSTAPQSSALDEQRAPAAALSRSLAGMVSQRDLPSAIADAQDKHTGTGPGEVPHMADPNIALIAKAGMGLTAGQDVHLSANDTATLASGQDTHFAVGGQARIHTGQAIGVLAGAMQPGDDSAAEAAGKGLTVIAAQGAIDMQAQAGAAQVAALQTMEIKTASGEVMVVAAKRVYLSTAGGAYIDISGGAFDMGCPGTITVQSGIRSMLGPAVYETPAPDLPKSDFCLPCFVRAMTAATPLVPT